MRKILTFLLMLFVAFHGSVALCLCQHESDKDHSKNHCHSDSSNHHSHGEQASETNHSSHHSKNNCCCIQKDESSLPTKIELGSIAATDHLILFIVSYVQPLSTNFIVTSPLNALHSLSPPGSPPLYLQKNTFLI